MLFNFEFSASEVIASFTLLALISLALVYFLRYSCNPKKIPKTQKVEATLRRRVKYAMADDFSYSKLLFKYGLTISIAAVLFAFNYSSYQPVNSSFNEIYSMETIDELEIPITTHEEPLPPLPPLPKTSTIIFDELMEITTDPLDELETNLKPTDSVQIFNASTKKSVEPPAPPPIEKEDSRVPRIFVEQMPRFPGCEDLLASNAYKKECADQKMIEYIYSTIKYPKLALTNNIEGTAIIRFTVNEDGQIRDITILRDPGAGLGQAALELVESMNSLPQSWTPGKQNGKAVKVLYTLPIKFKLQ